MKKGFTLIEILVVVAVLGIIMTTVVTIMLNSFKAKNRTDITNRLEAGGSYLIMDLRRNVLNSIGSEIICPVGGVGSSMLVTNRFDGQVTNIACLEAEAQVASGSFILSGSGVGVSGCNQFISCDTLPGSGEVGTINFSFDMYSMTGSSAPDSYVKRHFDNKVVVRNY